MHQRGIAEVHPDSPLNDRDQQNRHPGGVEGEEKHHQDNQDRDHADHDIINLKGFFEFILVGGIAHHIDVAFRIMALRNLTDGIRKTEGLVAGFRQRQIDQHPVIVFSLQLTFAHQHLGSCIGKRVGLLSFQIDVPLIDLVADVKQHVDQRNAVFRDAADQFVITPVLDGIHRVEEFRRFIVQLQQVREFARRQLVRQLVPAHGVDPRDGRHRVHLREVQQFIHQALFLAVVPSGDHHRQHGAGGKGIADHFLRDLILVLPRGGQRVIAVDIGAAVGKREGRHHQHDEGRRDHGACRPGKAADKRDLRHKGLVLGLIHEVAEDHQEARHHQENGEQGEQDGLDQADGHIRAQLELHEHHGDQAADGGQAARPDLRDRL